MSSELFSAPKDTVDTMKNGWLEMDANNEDVLGEIRPRHIMNAGEDLVAECFISPEISVNILPGTFSMTKVAIKAEDLVPETIPKSIKVLEDLLTPQEILSTSI
ncbi:hypothetical protein EYC80_005211 [Monilinia laxa]|uniref:Uncharacterized protein n=1 Tax=Monilinia laxa TaxID=61186 RepID=A0A5N6KJ68_MONLA|nr:hypothetical protein EYC80_005211 [Monilinia laxa]